MGLVIVSGLLGTVVFGILVVFVFYRKRIVLVDKEVRDETTSFVGIKLQNGTILDYVGEAIPEDIVENVNKTYLIAKGS